MAESALLLREGQRVDGYRRGLSEDRRVFKLWSLASWDCLGELLLLRDVDWVVDRWGWRVEGVPSESHRLLKSIFDIEAMLSSEGVLERH